MTVQRKRANLFGFGRRTAPEASSRRRKSALTLAAASRLAHEAGYRGTYTFSDWLELKHLGERGPLIIERLGEAYRAGTDQREADDRLKDQAREAEREKARAKIERKRDLIAEKAGNVDENKLAAAFKRGLSLREALAENPSLRRLKQSNPAKFDRCVKAVKARGGAVSPYAVCKAAMKGKRNPAEAATEAFEEFHGHAPTETVEVRKQVHFHKHLAGAGKLVTLVVKGVDHQTHKISGFKGALLAFSESGKQLFIEGGDQAINLEEFGITDPHEVETLGKVLEIEYATDKHHLGKEGGKAVYAHQFRTTNEDGEHVTVTIARYPDLIYRVLDEQLEFSGGSYQIKAEGIDR